MGLKLKGREEEEEFPQQSDWSIGYREPGDGVRRPDTHTRGEERRNVAERSKLATSNWKSPAPEEQLAVREPFSSSAGERRAGG